MMFLATLKGKLIAILGGVVAVLSILLTVYRKGVTAARDEIKADTVDKIIDIDKKEKEIDEQIRNDDISDVRNRLRDNASDAK